MPSLGKLFGTIFICCHVVCVFSIPYDRQCHILYEHDASKKGEVISPFYDEGAYPDGLWCEYRIRAPEGYRIKLTFKDLDIDPTGSCKDSLVVYSKAKEGILGEYCGNQIPRPILSKPGESEIMLLFFTDFMISGRGFIIQYESAPDMELCNKNEGTCRNRNCYPVAKKCDGVDDCGDGTDEEKCGNPVALPSEDCGLTPIVPNTIYRSADRQVGGIAATPNSWPWQVSLQHTWKEPNAHFCGGSLISPQWVVTAAHCVAGKTGDPHDMKIVLGSHSKYNKTKYEVTRVAERIISYPDLEGEKLRFMTFTHDVALIKLNAPVAYSDGIQPACLPYLGWDIQPGTVCYSTGWGETRGSGFEDVLKQTEQIVQSKDNCSFDVKTQVCVAKVRQSPCHGDSGGPLSCRLGAKWWVFGATSFGSDTNMFSGLCGTPNTKVVFSSIPDKGDWIRKVIEKLN